jgi:hypothetical protein
VCSGVKEERLYLLAQFSFEDFPEGVFGQFFADFQVFGTFIGSKFSTAKLEKLLFVCLGSFLERQRRG